MIRIGVFTGSGRDAKPEPVIIKTETIRSITNEEPSTITTDQEKESKD